MGFQTFQASPVEGPSCPCSVGDAPGAAQSDKPRQALELDAMVLDLQWNDFHGKFMGNYILMFFTDMKRKKMEETFIFLG